MILSLESFESKCSFPPTKMQTLVPQSPISTHLSKKNNSCMRSMPTFKLDTTHFLFLNLISVLHKPTKLFSYLSFQMSFGLNHIYQSYLVFISEKYLKFVWVHFVRESTWWLSRSTCENLQCSVPFFKGNQARSVKIPKVFLQSVSSHRLSLKTVF